MSAFYNVDQPPFNMGSTARAIAAANNGLLFDIGDMSTLYQDAAGTVPVTAVEQPVGKILDKSGNGNHATQSVTASRPTLSARYNLLTKTEDFSDVAWDKIGTGGVTMLSNVATAPDGTTTAGKLIANPDAGTHYIQQAVTYTASAPHTCVIYIKAAEVSSLRLFLFSTAYGTKFNANTGVFSGTTVGLTTYAAQIVDGWWMVSLTATAPSSPVNRLEIYTADNNAGDGVSGIYIWHPDLRLGPTAGPYQRVNTSTDYDTNPTYFPKYLRFDGIDDYLNLPYMGLYAGGSASVVSSYRLNSKSTQALLLSEANSGNSAPLYYLHRHLGASGYINFLIRNDATTTICDFTDTNTVGIGVVGVKSSVDTGATIKQWDNSGDYDAVNYTRQGVVTLNNTTIGALIYTTTSSYFNGYLYGLIITKSALTDAQRVRCERFLARKAGVML